MKFFTTLITSSLAFAATVAAQGLTINTPPNLLLQVPAWLMASLLCLPGKVVKLPTSCVVPGSQSGATPLEDLGQQEGTSFTWNVDIDAGTSVGLELRDSTGALAQSAPVTIQ
ncbi:hypothetical protein D9758_011925 [Tetrapyrgos nigripes]|uniref:Uncharacterized protein n=1 Tax=Tetrapyrgos nigripes TaxID=182062 RepID=A0A8H5FWG4_9AGAR|nr:hypothetical protein D9758_011925 [Tetrapyrgos nigripes]